MSDLGTLPPDELLTQVYRCAAKNMIDEATDILFNNIDDMLCAGEFSQVNDIISRVDVSKLLTSSLLRAILCITWAAKDKLPAYKDLFAHVKQAMIPLEGEDVTEMLVRRFAP